MTPTSRSCRKYCGVVSDDEEILVRTTPSSPVGLHRVTDPAGAALPQAARVLDAGPELWPDEVRIDVETLNLDAASFRQLSEKHGGDGEAVRAEVLAIVAERGKMQNPVTGSGGMLIGTVAEVGPQSPLGLSAGDRVATLVSLSLTPLTLTDGLERWDGRSERVPAAGTAVLFGRSIAARLPEDLAPDLALMVMDVCGAPALVTRVVAEHVARGSAPTVAVLGAAGKSGSLSLAAARAAGAARCIGVVPFEAEAALLRDAPGLADEVVIADARSPARAVRGRRRRRGTGRRHGRLRRRPRVRAAGHPRHRPGRDGHLLLDGDELLGRGARRRGAGGRRHDARRQRLRPRARRPRPRPPALDPGRPVPLREPARARVTRRATDPRVGP